MIELAFDAVTLSPFGQVSLKIVSPAWINMRRLVLPKESSGRVRMLLRCGIIEVPEEGVIATPFSAFPNQDLWLDVENVTSEEIRFEGAKLQGERIEERGVLKTSRQTDEKGCVELLQRSRFTGIVFKKPDGSVLTLPQDGELPELKIEYFADDETDESKPVRFGDILPPVGYLAVDNPFGRLTTIPPILIFEIDYEIPPIRA
jgi:hypothetical protein